MQVFAPGEHVATIFCGAALLLPRCPLTWHLRLDSFGMVATAEALETLRSMFPDHDSEVLSSLLVATGGNVEDAIQQLLDGPQGGTIDADEVRCTTARSERTSGHTACRTATCIRI